MRKPTNDEIRARRARRLAKPTLRETTSAPKLPRKGPTDWVNPVLGLIEAWRAVEIARKAVEDNADFPQSELDFYVKRLVESLRRLIDIAMPGEAEGVNANSSPRLIIIGLTRVIDKTNEVAESSPEFARELADDSLYSYKARLFVACRELTSIQ